MEEKEIKIQIFDNEKYFLYDTILTEKNIYDIFAKVEDPKSIILAKQVMENNEEYYEIIEEGEEFDALAQELSLDSTAANGGLLGEFTEGQMVPEFEAATFAMEVGDISDPVKTQFGYHIIKLEAKNEESIPTYEEVADKVEKTLMFQKQGEVYQAKLNEVKAKFGDLVSYM